MARILIVEDNRDTMMVYRTVLEHFGHSVTEARNGELGLRLAHETLPDLITIDVSIPLIDGWELASRLKADPQTASIPLLAITAHSLATDHAKAYEVGMDGYLPKPVEPRRIVSEIERLLNGQPPTYPPPSPTTDPVLPLRIQDALQPNVTNGSVLARARLAVEAGTETVELDLTTHRTLPDIDGAISLFSAIHKVCSAKKATLRIKAHRRVCDELRTSERFSALNCSCESP